MKYGEMTWGEFRYGVSERRPSGRGRQRVPLDREITPSVEDALGAGFAMSSYDDVLDGAYPWDFKVDNTGDLMASRGIDELGKDIAWKTSVRANDLVGYLNTPNNRADLELDLQELIDEDERIVQTDSVDVDSKAPYPIGFAPGIDTIPVEINVNAITDRYHRHVIPIFV